MERVLSQSLSEMANAAVNQKLILQGVGWELYERILEEFTDSNGLRLAYDDGYLEVEVPLSQHEIPIRLLSDLVSTICVETEVNFRNVGSTTFRSRARSKGCEPDTAFYIKNEDRVRGLTNIDSSKDPPPDLVIEVDFTSPSLDKLPIYAALGVSEVWRYKGDRVEFYRLSGEFYQPTENSVFYPRLLAETANEFLRKGLTESSTEWFREIRQWINER